ncbi:1-phosphofructokinase family hexose kinase [Euzebya sp.]|uniref:1-phosphofructokinase family hexose kinase n=1 Tax=Euzebya sp. TaxID=1971409 RepID=UPI003515012C
MDRPTGPPRSGRIHIVCPNPALDRLQVVESLVTGAVNRAHDVTSLAGGKGIIVARGVRRLGGQATIHGFAGGAIGEMIRRGCEEIGAIDRHVEIRGDTRITAVVIESSSGASTVINERGPTVSDDDVGALLAGLADEVGPGDVVVCTGSLPPGAGHDLHGRAAALAGDRGALAIVDTHGPALAAAVEASPWMVKPNLAELCGLLDAELSADDLGGVVEAMATLRRRGVPAIAVTLGAAGVLHLDDEGAVHLTSPRVQVRNATGSGDMLLAGFVHALAAGLTPWDALRRGVAAGAANAEQVAPDIDSARVVALTDEVTARPVHAVGAKP